VESAASIFWEKVRLERRNQGEKSELLVYVRETVDVNGDLFKQRSEGQVYIYLQNMMSLLRNLAYP
jgi:hypothetical protein